MSETIFTAREIELFSKAIGCIKGGGEIQIDNDKFAEVGGFKNANSARVAWHNLKKKMQAGGATVADGNDSGELKSPASAKKRKAAAKADGDDVDGETPTKKATSKKGRKPRSNGKVIAAADEEKDANNAEENPTTQDNDELVSTTPTRKGQTLAVKKATQAAAKEDEGNGVPVVEDGNTNESQGEEA